MSDLDSFRHSYAVLQAAQDALGARRLRNDRESWATAVVFLRSPLANGIVTGAYFGYMCATVAAAAIIDMLVLRRVLRYRMALYGMLAYLYGLCGGVLGKILPEEWAANPIAMIGTSVAQTAVLYAVLNILAFHATRTLKPPPPATPEVDHG